MGNERLEFHADQPPEREEPIEISESTSLVGASKGKNLLFMGAMVVAAIVAFYVVVLKDQFSAPPDSSQVQSQNTTSEELQSTQDVPTLTREDVSASAAVPVTGGVVDTPDAPVIDVPDVLPPPPPPVSASPSSVDTNLPDVFIPPVDVPKEDVKKDEPKAPDGMDEVAAPEVPAELNLPDGQVSPEQASALQARRSSSILKFGSSGVMGQAGNSGNVGIFGGASNQPSTGILPTAAQQSRATYLGRMDSVIAQGKIIDAVLETAINTDLQGVLRAVVSRDVYAESGKTILIPRGSRLVGIYDSNIKRGQRRVAVMWTRVIRPDGIDMDIQSPGNSTDQLGRSGIAGNVDNRYWEIFGNSVLLSSLTIAGAFALETVTGSNSSGVTSSTTSSNQGTTSSQTGKPSDLAIANSVSNIGDVVKSIAESFAKTNPTITVPQGEQIKVFVNRDIVFPSSMMGGAMVVP